MKERSLVTVIILAIVLAVIGILTWINFLTIPHVSGGAEFRVPWLSARTFLFDGNSPYTLETAQNAQRVIYGRLAEAGEAPHYLDIPFYLLFLYFPFALIDNFDLARALWTSFAEIALAAIIFLSLHFAEWKPSRVLTSLFYLSLLFSFYALYPLIAGSGVVFTILVLLFSLLALREGWDEILGILLVFGTFRLQNGGVLFILILFWVITTKRWRVLSVSLMTVALFSTVSLMLLPDWFMPFIRSIPGNLRAEQGYLFSDLLASWQLERVDLVAQILRWLVVIILFIEWRAARGKDFHRLIWVASLSLALFPFLNLRVNLFVHVALFLPLALVFRIAENRWEAPARWVIAIILLLLLTSWGIFMVAENAFQILAYLLPGFLTIALYWLRWWYIRPPRTWADETARFR